MPIFHITFNKIQTFPHITDHINIENVGYSASKYLSDSFIPDSLASVIQILKLRLNCWILHENWIMSLFFLNYSLLPNIQVKLELLKNHHCNQYDRLWK